MRDGRKERVEGSCGGLSQGCFQLCKGLFYGVQIGAVGWQIAQCRAGPLDRFSNAGDFVTGKIVHDHDITLAQGRSEKVLDIGQETRSVHRPVEHTGRGDRIVAKRGNESRCHPMAMRHRGDEALTARRTPREPHQIGFRSSFINEDKMFRLQIGLACMPLLAGLGDIHAVLFSGAQ